jgi:hypothetical protein
MIGFISTSKFQHVGATGNIQVNDLEKQVPRAGLGKKMDLLSGSFMTRRSKKIGTRNCGEFSNTTFTKAESWVGFQIVDGAKIPGWLSRL